MSAVDDARRDLASDSAFLDGTSPFDAPGAGYRLNTWVRTRIPALLAELEPAPCDMKQGGPYDFAWCETHDTTFALGQKCKFDGRQPWEVFADEASAQRQLKVRAELTLDRTRGELDAALSTIQRMRDALPALLDEAWDDGNASGLDGWVGPGRGAGEIDDEAVHARRRSTDRLLARALDGGTP
ncbi:hypothetical protein PP515_gp61 [Gordonia phage Sidious]|uniref:Uncharacterized protein n=1 Tax=Gordonia phage Sidious TaxID=2591118 RepID=A0A515MIC2_9CAUD|nr:hypothetical protein PP515_gp61 [Gordonia phage Sidious]QDM56408.1 hypothetical protein SEA_SIDIOUS_61 [Gordonia phage Sidious]